MSSDVFTLSDASVCQYGLPSNQVKLDHVRAVIEYDAERELKVAIRLFKVHGGGGHFTQMKVGIAVQLFREAPAAIRYSIKEEILEPEAETTVRFLEVVSKWYTLMSARHPSVILSLQDMMKYQPALGTLHLALETFQEMHMGSTSQWKPSQAGLMITTTVVLRLQDVLLNSESFKFFLTGRILQDCLEKPFFVVSGRKPVPNAYDFKCALKIVCVSQFLHTPSTTSYEVYDSQYLNDVLS